MALSIVVAMDRERVIGRDGDLPWRLPNDLQRFRAITMGHPIIMGRRTFESIGRPLPGRHNIVVSRRRGFEADGCSVADGLPAALEIAGAGECMVVGGAMLYAEALPLARRLYLTEVDASVAGDTWFPDFDRDRWRELARERYPADERHAFDYAYALLERRG